MSGGKRGPKMNYQELLKEYVEPIIDKIRKPKPDDVLEIEIYDGFNDESAHITLKSIVSLYADAGLAKDPQWHFFFEGDFVVFRFSRKFADKVESTLKEMGVKKYVGPKEWKESTYVTERFQYNFFVHMFHLISEGVMTLLLDKNRKEDMDYYISCIAERMIHAWFNHNLCSAVVFGKNIKSFDQCQTWEALIVSGIGLERARYAGKYEYIRALQKAKKDKENSEQNPEIIL